MVSDTEPSHFFGVVSDLDITKFANRQARTIPEECKHQWEPSS